MEEKYDVDYRLFGDYFTITVTATSCDAAMKKVEEMDVLELLKGKRLSDFGYAFGARSVNNSI